VPSVAAAMNVSGSRPGGIPEDTVARLAVGRISCQEIVARFFSCAAIRVRWCSSGAPADSVRLLRTRSSF